LSSLEVKVKEWVETALQTQLELPCKLRLPRDVRRKLGLKI
jgi:hypothetical protein